MKKIILIIACFSLLGLTSCFIKKDRTCECTTTYTSPSGVTTTDPAPQVVTIKEVNKHDAKSLCQKVTDVNVNPNGETSTWVSDCKLK